MTNTAKILLKILLHGDLHEDDLEKYFSLDSASIKRNLQILNDTLILKNLGYITKFENYYTIMNKSSEFSTYLSEIDILSPQERVDILCIKLLLDSNLNLEKMRVDLDLSRTTISIDFKNLKTYLNANDIKVDSKIFKGIFIEDVFNPNIKYILCEKFMTLFINKYFLTKSQNILLKQIDVLDKDEFYNSYIKIVKKFNLITSIYTFYAIYSMRCVEILNDNCVFDKKIWKNHPEFENILISLNELHLNFTQNFKLFITDIIVRVKFTPLFNAELENSFNYFIDKLKDLFDLNLEEKLEITKLLLGKYKVGYLNYRYDSFNISGTDRVHKKIEFCNILEKIISDSNTNMMYRDILVLADLIFDYFLKKEYSKDFKILFIIKDLDYKYYNNVFTKIKAIYPKIEIIIDTVLNLKYGKIENLNQYSLIISEYEKLNLQRYVFIGLVNLKEVQIILDTYILDKMLLKINEKMGG
ncbi:MAG: hypothetical protein ACRC5G_06445 [Cetobacterium sp.]